MTSRTIIKELQEAVPQFHVDPDWLDGNLTYLAINDFARYICSEAVICSVSATIPRHELRKAGNFLKEALHIGDDEVPNLIFECLESICDTLRTSDQLGLVTEYFGLETRNLWKPLRRVVAGTQYLFSN